jgi:hypothetical protein
MSDREVTGERLESSQPARKLPERAIKPKAGSRFMKGLRRMDISPTELIVLGC